MAVNNGRYDERAVVQVVHAVAEFAGRFGGLEDAAVEFGVVGGGHCQKCLCELLGLEFAA